MVTGVSRNRNQRGGKFFCDAKNKKNRRPQCYGISLMNCPQALREPERTTDGGMGSENKLKRRTS